MNDAMAIPAMPYPVPANIYAQPVLSVRHHTDRLFSFSIARPPGFRFRSGEFVMIGLPNAEKPVYRAYSIASPAWDDQLEFYSIKVPDGPLTQHLQKVSVGDTVLMRPKSTGTLVLDTLIPAKRLYMISTGTGIAPFASLARDPETYDKFDEVILTHTCRDIGELDYGRNLIDSMSSDPMIAEFTGGRLRHYFTTTREPYPSMGRITDLMNNGALFAELGVGPLDPENDRLMICGSMDMLRELKAISEACGLEEGTHSRPGHFAIERAFVD